MPKGDSQPLHYDYLVYALAAIPTSTAFPVWKGICAVVGIKKTTSIQLRDRLPAIAQRGGKLVVVGGGLTGVKSATELAEAYPSLKVTLITRDSFGAQLSEAGQQYLRQTFDRLHITVIDHAAVNRVTADQVQYENGALDYDACLWTGSLVSDLAAKSGLQVNDRGRDPHE